MTQEKCLEHYSYFLKDFEKLEFFSKIDSIVPNRIFKNNWELFDFHYDWEDALNPLSKTTYKLIPE